MIKNLISIVIPIYNKESSLKRCLDSVIRQTYSDIEIILIDDGSIDQSEKICRQYCIRDNRINYYYQENKGPSLARNLGIEKANGEWIIFIDADDYVDLRMCEIALNNARDGNTEVVLWGSENEWGKMKTEIRISDDKVLCLEGKESVRSLNKLMALGHFAGLRANYILDGPCCKMIHSNVLKGCHFPEGIDYGEDSCFCAILYDTVLRVKWINEILYHRIVTEGSLSNRRDDDLAYRKAKFIKWLIDYWQNKMDSSDIKVFVIQNVSSICFYYVENSNLSFAKQRQLLNEAFKGIELNKYISSESLQKVPIKSRMILECYCDNRLLLYLLFRYIIKPIKQAYHLLKFRL